jgi:hypothetical protein
MAGRSVDMLGNLEEMKIGVLGEVQSAECRVQRCSLCTIRWQGYLIQDKQQDSFSSMLIVGYIYATYAAGDSDFNQHLGF